MRRFFTFACLLVGVLTFGGRAFAAEPCKLALLGDLHVTLGPAGGVLMPVSVNGQEVWMILALNSGFSGIFPDAAALLNLQPHKLMQNASTGSHVRSQSEAIKAGKQTLEDYVRIESLRLGNLELGGFEAVLAADWTGPMPRYQGKPIVGRLGSSLTKLFDLELNLAEEDVRLFKQDSCKDAPVYWATSFTALPLKFDASGTLTFHVDLEGKKTVTAFATDIGNSLLDQHATDRYFGFKMNSPAVEHAVLPNGQPVAYHAMSVTAEGVTVNHARVRLIERRDSPCKLERDRAGAIAYGNCFNITPFALGTDLLKKVRLIIAGKQENIYLTAAEGKS